MTDVKMTHADLQEQVVALLHIFSWRHLHVRTTLGKVGGHYRHTTSTNVIGWPDLAPCWNPSQPGRVLALELKVPPDKPRPEQAAVLRELAASGIECHVIRPADIPVRLPRLLDRAAYGHLTHTTFVELIEEEL
jgi:hypothetical protein